MSTCARSHTGSARSVWLFASEFAGAIAAGQHASDEREGSGLVSGPKMSVGDAYATPLRCPKSEIQQAEARAPV